MQGRLCLPSPSPDIVGEGVLQGAEFVSRIEGQKTLKLWHSPHFSVSRIYSCFGDSENYLTLWWLASPLLRKFILVVIAYIDLQVSCPVRMMPSTVELPQALPRLVSTPAGPHRALLLLLWCCLAATNFGPPTYLSSCPAQDLFPYCHTAHAQPEKDERKETPAWARPTQENPKIQHRANH